MHTALAIALISMAATADAPREEIAPLIGTYFLDHESYADKIRELSKVLTAADKPSDRAMDQSFLPMNIYMSRELRTRFTLDADGTFTLTGSQRMHGREFGCWKYDGRWGVMGDHVVLIDPHVVPQGHDKPIPGLAWAVVFDRAGDGSLVLNAGKTVVPTPIRGVRFEPGKRARITGDITVPVSANTVKGSPFVGTWEVDTKAYAAASQQEENRLSEEWDKDKKMPEDGEPAQTGEQPAPKAGPNDPSAQPATIKLDRENKDIAAATVTLRLADDGTYTLDSSGLPADTFGPPHRSGQWGMIGNCAVCFGDDAIPGYGRRSFTVIDEYGRAVFVLEPDGDADTARMIAGTLPAIQCARPFVPFTRIPDNPSDH